MSVDMARSAYYPSFADSHSQWVLADPINKDNIQNFILYVVEPVRPPILPLW